MDSDEDDEEWLEMEEVSEGEDSEQELVDLVDGNETVRGAATAEDGRTIYGEMTLAEVLERLPGDWSWAQVSTRKLRKMRPRDLLAFATTVQTWCSSVMTGTPTLPNSIHAVRVDIRPEAREAIKAFPDVARNALKHACVRIKTLLILHYHVLALGTKHVFPNEEQMEKAKKEIQQGVQDNIVTQQRHGMNMTDPHVVDAVRRTDGEGFHGYAHECEGLTPEQTKQMLEAFRRHEEALRVERAKTAQLAHKKYNIKLTPQGTVDAESLRRDVEEFTRWQAENKRRIAMGTQTLTITEFRQQEMADKIAKARKARRGAELERAIKHGMPGAGRGFAARSVPTGAAAPEVRRVYPNVAQENDAETRQTILETPRPFSFLALLSMTLWRLQVVMLSMFPSIAVSIMNDRCIPTSLVRSINVSPRTTLRDVAKWPLGTCMHALDAMAHFWVQRTCYCSILYDTFQVLEWRIAELLTVPQYEWMMNTTFGFTHMSHAPNGTRICGPSVFVIDRVSLIINDMRRAARVRSLLMTTPHMVDASVPPYVGHIIKDDDDDDNDSQASSVSGAGSAYGEEERKGVDPNAFEREEEGTSDESEFDDDDDDDDGRASAGDNNEANEEEDMWKIVPNPDMIKKTEIVYDAFPPHTIPRMLAVESPSQARVRETMAQLQIIRSERYRLPPRGWVASAEMKFREWVTIQAVNTEQSMFTDAMEMYVKQYVIRPGSAVELMRYGLYKDLPNMETFETAICRGWPPYSNTVSSYVAGTLYSEEMVGLQRMQTTQAAALLHTFPEEPFPRQHYAIAHVVMEMFANRTRNGVLRTFFLTVDDIASLNAHLGPNPTYATNVPIVVHLDDTYWVVYLNHIVVRSRNYFHVMVHWLWMFVFVCVLTNAADRHIAFANSLRQSMGFLDPIRADAFVRLEFEAQPPRTYRARRPTEEVTIDPNIARRKTRRLNMEDINEAMAQGTKRMMRRRGLVDGKALFG